MNDEIIAEVRAMKDYIGAKFNYDLRALFEEIKRGEAELQGKGFRLIPPQPTLTTCLTLHCNEIASKHGGMSKIPKLA